MKLLWTQILTSKRMMKSPVMIIGSLQITAVSRKKENSSMKEEIVTGCFWSMVVDRRL